MLDGDARLRGDILRATFLALGTVVLSGCSVFGIRSEYEQPRYTVAETLGDSIEVRRYDQRTAAEAVVEADDAMAGRNAAFRVLFDYITGANQPQAEIAMTAPVESKPGSAEIAMTAPVETASKGTGRVSMRFFLPSSYTPETAPRPTDARVQIVAVPEETVAVLRFTGSTQPDTVEARKAELLDALEGSNWQPSGDPVAYFYDPPWTIPFLRRNEVAVPVTVR